MKTINTLAALAALVISSVTSAAPVNINTADAAEIAAALNGVGLSKAQAIVDYRQAYGMFNKADEIVFVRGIGEATYENNKGDILVK
ncbi:MAG: helix-hairpin-helix domain-containing protein [Gammaproteobacteria bacterium]|nr:helix-hairpin-helix domain-containing protein [Gammaproteobacteria bacterium]